MGGGLRGASVVFPTVMVVDLLMFNGRVTPRDVVGTGNVFRRNRDWGL
jgi:hypothetical protein